MLKIICIVLFVFGAKFVYSSTYIVTNTNETGTGSLSDAITQANNNLGPDIITFNIPTSDVGYNSLQGTWNIVLTMNLPYLTGGDLFIDASTQTNNNPEGPEITISTSDPANIYWAFGVFSSNNTIKGFCINGFLYGIILSENFSQNNTITECYIGTNPTASSAIGNTNGILISNAATGNTILKNVLSGNTNGVVISNASGNSIYDNIIGADKNGLQGVANSYGIVLTSGSDSTMIQNNLISGNTNAGVMISKANSNTIIGNKIGTNNNGNAALPNNNGLMLDSTINNRIGGAGANLMVEKNLISGNHQSGIVISGRISTNNIVQGNFIGTDYSGTAKIPNLYGITLTKASGNIIGRQNLISGNTDIGILLTGRWTRNNIIRGNLIGTDITGTQLLDNHKGIIMKSLANNNLVGGKIPEDRNIVSGNLEIGIYIEAADSNKITGNYIGTDITGMNKVAIGQIGMNDSLVQGNGVEFNIVARHNILGGYEYGERNIISGHKVYGVVYYGHCDHNHLYNNFIGTDITSKNPLPNATGICFDCASNHNDVINCVLSGNIGYGLFYVTRGTEYNRLLNNMIGVDSSGTVAVPNDIGMVVSTGCAYNTIRGNVFSGNNLSGIMITNQLTEYNVISNNKFGTDISGTFAIPNLYGVMFSTFCKHNTLDSNLVSGNLEAGIIVNEKADSNSITNNKIGTDITGTQPLPNLSAGIYLDQGVQYNTIGRVDAPNIIAFNDAGGILIRHEETLYNKISGNSIFSNNGLGIDIYPFGVVNPNDAGDYDTGAAEMMNTPIITSATYNLADEITYISGTLDCQNPSLKIIEIFIAQPDNSNAGQGKVFVGSVIPDSNGNWSLATNSLIETDVVTATSIDEKGNTSEFSQNLQLITSVENIFNVLDNVNLYPNPCTEELRIKTKENKISVTIFDNNGKQIKNTFFVEKNTDDICIWNLRDSQGKRLPKGQYIISLKMKDGNSIIKKVTLL